MAATALDFGVRGVLGFDWAGGLEPYIECACYSFILAGGFITFTLQPVLAFDFSATLCIVCVIKDPPYP